MTMALQDIIKTALDKLQYIAKTETVVGEPIIAGSVTLIPVSKVSIGFAAGGSGQEKRDGAGTGGGVSVTPVAFIVVNGDRVSVQPVSKNDPDIGKILSMAPDLIKRVSKFMDKDKKEPKEKPKS